MFTIDMIKTLFEKQTDCLIATPDKSFAIYKFIRENYIELRFNDSECETFMWLEYPLDTATGGIISDVYYLFLLNHRQYRKAREYDNDRKGHKISFR